MQNKIIIGLDPGTHTGVAVIKSDSPTEIQLATLSPYETVHMLEHVAKCTARLGTSVHVWLEETRSLPPYDRNRKHAIAVQRKIARGVGQVDATIKLYCEVIEAAQAKELPIFHYPVSPDRSGKLSHEQLKER